jgi:hypothetical protein
MWGINNFYNVQMIIINDILTTNWHSHSKRIPPRRCQVPNPQECGGSGGCQGATVELGIAWAVQ